MSADGIAGPKNDPRFLDLGANDTANDLNILAQYAAKVGNRRVDTTTERLAATGKDVWEGLRWGDTTDDLEYEYRGGGWVVAGGGTVKADITTFGTGWTATNTAGHKPRLRRRGDQVFLYGAVTLGTGGTGITNLLTIPEAFRPVDSNTTFVGGGVTNSGAGFELALAAGVLSIPAAYITGNINAQGTVVPVKSDWPID